MSCDPGAALPTFADPSTWTLSPVSCTNTATIHVNAGCGSTGYSIRLRRVQNAVTTTVYTTSIPDGPLSGTAFSYDDAPPCGNGEIGYYWEILCEGSVQSTSDTKSVFQGDNPTIVTDTLTHDPGSCENVATLRVTTPCGTCGGSAKLYRSQGGTPSFVPGEVVYTGAIGTGPTDNTFTHTETPPCIRGLYYYQWRIELTAGNTSGTAHSAVSGGAATITFEETTVDSVCNITSRIQVSKPCGECAGTVKLFRKLNTPPTFDAGEMVFSDTVPAGPLIGTQYEYTEAPGDGIWHYAWRVYADTAVVDDESSDMMVTAYCNPYIIQQVELPAGEFEKLIVLVQVTGSPAGGLIFTDKKILNLAEQRFEWWYHKNGGCAGFRLLTHELIDDEFFEDTIAQSWEVHVRIKLGGESDYTTWYRGVVRAVKHQEQGTDEYADINGYGYVEMLDKIQVQRIYAAGWTVKQIVDDIIATDVKPYTRIVRPVDLDITNGDSGVSASGYVIQDPVHFECSALRAIKWLAELQGGREWGVDAHRQFYFRPTSTDLGASFFLAKDVIDRVAGGKSFGQTNSIKMAGKSYGSRDHLKIREDVTDVTNYGRRETTVEVPWVTGDADASRWADNIINANKGRQDWAVITKKSVTSHLDASHPLPQITVYGEDVSNDVHTYDIAKIQYMEGGVRAPQEIREKGAPKKQGDSDQPLKAMYYLGKYPNDLIDELRERAYDQIEALKGRHKQVRVPNDVSNLPLAGHIPGEFLHYRRDVTNLDVTNNPAELQDYTNPRGVALTWLDKQWTKLSTRRTFHVLPSRGKYIGEMVSLITDVTSGQFGELRWWTGTAWEAVGSGSSGGGGGGSGASLGSLTPTSIEPDDTGVVGVATYASREDHQHAIVTDVALDVTNTNAEGVATSFSRSDHRHRGIRTVKLKGGADIDGYVDITNGIYIRITQTGNTLAFDVDDLVAYVNSLALAAYNPITDPVFWALMG